jgi:sugar/nucleoside kinase (ribokinase family)
MYDVISIGDLMYDVFLQLPPNEVQVDTSGPIQKLVMEFGTKLPIEKMTAISAVGNCANNAIGSARLGLKVALYTYIGDDREGQESKKVLEEEGVALDYVIIETGKKTNYSAVINVGAERTILIYHEHRPYNLPDLQPTKWVYYTSVAKGHEILHTQIPAYCDNTGAKLAFQPGSHQLREGLEVLKPLIARSDFLIMNKEEGEGLLGKQAGCAELVKDFMNLGAKMVAITDGPQGSFAADGETVYFQDIYDVEVVERTGCGDAYATGFLAAIIKNLPLTEAMKWGTVNAAGKLRFIGAREGLLRENEIKEWLSRKPQFGPVNIEHLEV